MALKIVILIAVLAVSNAGLIGGPLGYAAPALATSAITAQQSNIRRTPGNLGQISTYSKSINIPFSSVRKSDVRVSNDAFAYGSVAAPLATHAIAAPVIGVAHVSFNGLGTSYSW